MSVTARFGTTWLHFDANAFFLKYRLKLSVWQFEAGSAWLQTTLWNARPGLFSLLYSCTFRLDPWHLATSLSGIDGLCKMRLPFKSSYIISSLHCCSCTISCEDGETATTYKSFIWQAFFFPVWFCEENNLYLWKHCRWFFTLIHPKNVGKAKRSGQCRW